MTVFEPSALPSLAAAPPENPWKRYSSPAAPSTAVDDPSAVIDFDDASWPALSSLPAAQVPPPPPPSPSSVQQPPSSPPPPPPLPTPVQPSSPAPETATAPPAPDIGAVRPPAAPRNPRQWRVRDQQQQRWAPNPRHGGSRHPPDAGDLFRRESSQFYYNQGYMNGFTAPPEWRYRPSFGVPEMPPPTNWPPPSAGGPPFPPPYGGNAGAPFYCPPYHSPYPGGNAGAPPYRPLHHSPYGGGYASGLPYGPPYVDYHHNSFYPGPNGGEFQISNGYPMPQPQPVEFHQMNNWLVHRPDSNWNQQNRWRNDVPQSSNNHSGQECLDCQDNQAGVQHQTGHQDPNGESETPQTRVRKQIEYYFCDQNLENDNYLKRIMDAEGWVDIHKIANFRRVQRITGDIKLVREAMQSSDSVELQDDKLRKRSGWEKYIITSMRNLQLDK